MIDRDYDRAKGRKLSIEHESIEYKKRDLTESAIQAQMILK